MVKPEIKLYSLYDNLHLIREPNGYTLVNALMLKNGYIELIYRHK